MTRRASAAHAEACEVRILYSADLMPAADAAASPSDPAASGNATQLAFIDATLGNTAVLVETLQRQAGDT